MPYDHVAAIEVEKLLRDCEVQRTRASGPGGQHRNKVETAIVIRHKPSGISGQASERRSQDLNHQMAVLRLRTSLALGVRSAFATLPALSELWSSRTPKGKIRISSEHDDFPALLAESLDHAAYHGWQLRPTAENLLISSSQLVGFWCSDPHALIYVNQQRAAIGLGNLIAK